MTNQRLRLIAAADRLGLDRTSRGRAMVSSCGASGNRHRERHVTGEIRALTTRGCKRFGARRNAGDLRGLD